MKATEEKEQYAIGTPISTFSGRRGRVINVTPGVGNIPTKYKIRWEDGSSSDVRRKEIKPL